MSLDAEREGGGLTRAVTDALLLLETKLFFSFVQEGSSHQTRESHLREKERTSNKTKTWPGYEPPSVG